MNCYTQYYNWDRLQGSESYNTSKQYVTIIQEKKTSIHKLYIYKWIGLYDSELDNTYNQYGTIIQKNIQYW